MTTTTNPTIATIAGVIGIGDPEHVLLVAPTMREAAYALDAMQYELAERTATFRRGHGVERLTLTNGATVRVASRRNLGSIRGYEFDWIAVDERAWSGDVEAAVAPSLRARGGYAFAAVFKP